MKQKKYNKNIPKEVCEVKEELSKAYNKIQNVCNQIKKHNKKLKKSENNNQMQV